jgi:hypothetical protein
MQERTVDTLIENSPVSGIIERVSVSPGGPEQTDSIRETRTHCWSNPSGRGMSRHDSHGSSDSAVSPAADTVFAL